MNLSAVDEVVHTLATAQGQPAGDYAIVAVKGQAKSGAYFARSRDGVPTLLIPVREVSSSSTRLTSGLALKAEPTLQFAYGKKEWQSASAVIECRSRDLVHTFAAMAIALSARVEPDQLPTWEFVASLFSEWEALLSRRRVLGEEVLLGLWGELWFLAHCHDPNRLVASWRGPDGAAVDFFIDGRGFEVKTSRRARVHQVSQRQVDGSQGNANALLISLFASVDPLRGLSVPDLVRQISGRTTSIGALEEKLAHAGYFREDAPSYVDKFVLLEAPLVFPVDAVPRVRQADKGVSRLRYEVELDRATSLAPAPTEEVWRTLGIDLTPMEFPCA